MKYEDRKEMIFSRVSLALASLSIIGIENAVVYLLGYGGIWMIAFDIFLSGLALFLLAASLLPSERLLPSFRGSLFIFVLLDVIAQVEIQTMNNFNISSWLPRVLVPLLAALVMIAARNRIRHLPDLRGMRFSPYIQYFTAGIFAIVLILYILVVKAPFSDEFTIDRYSALVFVHGLDPYLGSVTSQVFHVLPIPATAMTPTLTGGYVTSLSYPPLSFLIFVPSQALKFNPYLTLIPLYVLPILLVKRNISLLTGIAVCTAFLIQPLLLTQYSLGFSDILWAGLSALSIILMRKPLISGISMGLALTLKQVPVLLVPFLIILLIKKSSYRAASKFIAGAALVFLLISLYFVYLQPSAFVHDLLAPEVQNLIGIGFGPSQISFLGFVHVSRDFFTFMMIFMLAFLVGLYLLYPSYVGYGFIAFPAIIFVFNYRMIAEYLMYWPIISALLIPWIFHENNDSDWKRSETIRIHWKSVRKIAIVAIILTVIPVGAAIHFQEPPTVSVNSIQPHYYSNGSLSYMTVNLTYTGSENVTHPLFLRFVGQAPMINQNGYLWGTSVNVSLFRGESYSINIEPISPSDYIAETGEYRAIVYYEHDLGEYSKKVLIHD